jgi:hypothetical protein
MKLVLRFGMLLLLVGVALQVTGNLAPAAQENIEQLELGQIRTDMEILADRVFGGGSRPDFWTGNLDTTSPNMLADLWFDNEVLADAVFGSGTRPDGWIGATTNNPRLVARNIRHDLELSADAWLGAGSRPGDWVGGVPAYRCSRTVMNSLYILDFFYNTRPTTSEAVVDYCESVIIEIEEDLIDQALGAGALDAEETNVPSLTLAVRGDLERLADELLGVNNRPPGWIDNTDINSPNLANDIQVDMSVLADVILGRGVRPPEWIGTLRESQLATFRSLRFDLELLADATLGEDVRPASWQGDDPIFACNPTVQYLVFLAEASLGYEILAPETVSGDYCETLRTSVNDFVENPPLPEIVEGTEEPEGDQRYIAESRNAFAYLDVAATEYMGVLPWGVEFRAWYRNFNESNMMFVSGSDFALFIDRRWTTMPESTFATLPTLDGVRPLTFCDANWCNGPAPTPTPTGSGPLLEIITANTPPAPIPTSPAEGTPETGAKVPVSWNYIRVNYLLQRSEINAWQVALEICRDPNQVVCEPVLSVFDNSTGQFVPIVSTFSGLNVFELPYGYSTNYTIEGANYISQDIWLNDPSLQSP